MADLISARIERRALQGTARWPEAPVSVRRDVSSAVLVSLLLAQSVAFGVAAASGKIPEAVFALFRALLTL